jgi:peptidoglycan-N-acetylglucosamine deacetylase
MRAVRASLAAVMAAVGAISCSTSPPVAAPTATAPPAESPTLSAPPTVTPTVTPSHPVQPTGSVVPPSQTRPAPGTSAPYPAWLRGKDVERIPTSSKIIALTFDAGSSNAGVAAILEALAAGHVSATFFLTGDFVRRYPSDARRIAAAGHRLGNHSINHPHFPALTDAQIGAQLSSAGTAIRTTTGRSPAPLFRFPYGDRDTRTIAAVNAAGYVAVRWTVDSLGWQGTMNGTRGPDFVNDRILAAAVPGGIVLMHVGAHPTDHSTLDADALPAVISGLRAQGYRFVTLDALLG